jgi:heat shock protein HslJ
MQRSPLIILIAVVSIAIACSPRGSDTANGGLGNTSWTVTSVNGAPTVPGAQPTMTFAADGTISGDAGCNQYSGRFRTDGGAIAIGEVASTMMLCEGDRGIQEAAFLSALQGASRWELGEDGNLRIGGAGEIVAGPGVAEGPPGDPPLPDLGGSAWTLAEMGGTADFERLVPTLEFGADGTVSGFAGCNTFSGTYTVSGGDLRLGPLATTKIGCERPASAVEAAYLEALAAVTTWSVDGTGQLLLGGAVSLTFTP